MLAVGPEEAPHVEVVDAAFAKHEVSSCTLAQRDADQSAEQSGMPFVPAFEVRQVVQGGAAE